MLAAGQKRLAIEQQDCSEIVDDASCAARREPTVHIISKPTELGDPWRNREKSFHKKLDMAFEAGMIELSLERRTIVSGSLSYT